MYYEKAAKLSDYDSWNAEIFKAIKGFIDEYKIAPTIILTNTKTHDKISLVMSKEIIEEGKVKTPQLIDVFACEIGEVSFCLEEDLIEKEFVLIYDEKSVIVKETDYDRALKKKNNPTLKLVPEAVEADERKDKEDTEKLGTKVDMNELTNQEEEFFKIVNIFDRFLDSIELWLEADQTTMGIKIKESRVTCLLDMNRIINIDEVPGLDKLMVPRLILDRGQYLIITKREFAFAVTPQTAYSYIDIPDIMGTLELESLIDQYIIKKVNSEHYTHEEIADTADLINTVLLSAKSVGIQTKRFDKQFLADHKRRDDTPSTKTDEPDENSRYEAFKAHVLEMNKTAKDIGVFDFLVINGKEFSHREDFNRLVGKLTYEHRQYKHSLHFFRKALEIEPTNINTLAYISELTYELNDYDYLINTVTKLYTKLPQKSKHAYYKHIYKEWDGILGPDDFKAPFRSDLWMYNQELELALAANCMDAIEALCPQSSPTPYQELKATSKAKKYDLVLFVLKTKVEKLKSQKSSLNTVLDIIESGDILLEQVPEQMRPALLQLFFDRRIGKSDEKIRKDAEEAINRAFDEPLSDRKDK